MLSEITFWYSNNIPLHLEEEEIELYRVYLERELIHVFSTYDNTSSKNSQIRLLFKTIVQMLHLVLKKFFHLRPILL